MMRPTSLRPLMATGLTSHGWLDRKIECTLMLSPMNLKAWAIMLQRELERYERLFGTIPPPEAVRQKFRER